jgi:hypothetical protein
MTKVVEMLRTQAYPATEMEVASGNMGRLVM